CIEDDQGDPESRVLVVGVAARIVELVEDVVADPAGPPPAVVRLAGAVALDGDVVGMDLGAYSIEEDPSLAADRGDWHATGKQPPGELLDDRSAELAADGFPSSGDLEGDVEQRIGAIADRLVRRRPEEGREQPGPGRSIRRLAVHDRARHHAQRGIAVVEHVRGAPDQRIGLDAGIYDRPPIASGILEPHGRSPRAMSAICGNVESQSIARCGSSIRPTSPKARPIVAAISGATSSLPRIDRAASKRSRQASVRSWMYDHSSSTSSPSSANDA